MILFGREFSAFSKSATDLYLSDLRIWDGVLSPEERRALEDFRERYGIPDADQAHALARIGWTHGDWEAGRQKAARRFVLICILVA